MTKTKERQALTYEIKARENLLKRLEYPRKQLEGAVKKEDEQRQAVIQKAAEFSSIEDAREMWGLWFYHRRRVRDGQTILREQRCAYG